MKKIEDFGLRIPEILLPKNIDVSSWSVIACDQYTQDLDYWKRAESCAAGKPSTLNLILPEVYLGSPDKAQRIEKIRQSEVVGLEECNEVLEAVHRGPGTADDAADSLVILEGDLDTVHRKIVEDDQVDQSRKDQKIEPAVLENAVSQFSES